jgi:hypothetical protein
MEPAATIVHKLGGPTKVARLLNLHRSAVYHWTWPRARGGSDGIIPHKYMSPLVHHARAHGIKLKPGDFVGRLSQE